MEQDSRCHATNGHCYTVYQWEGRWKSPVKGVKRVADHNAKTGNAPKKHPFEDELEFYSEQPNVKPAYLVSRVSKKTVKKKVGLSYLFQFLYLPKRNTLIFQMSWMFFKYIFNHKARDTKKTCNVKSRCTKKDLQ